MKKIISPIILISLLLSFFPMPVLALVASEVRQQISETNKQIEALDKEIANYQSQISETSSQSKTLNGLIKELTLTRSKLVKEKEQIQKKITTTGLVINTISGNISQKEKSINNLKSSLAQAIKDLNQNDNLLVIERLLAVDDFNNFSRDYNNIVSLNQKVQDNIHNLADKKIELLSTKSQKEIEQQNLNELKSNLVQKEQIVLIAKSEKDSLLSKTKNQEAAYQKLLAEKIKIRDAFDKALEDYEAQLKFILNPKILPKEGSGVLSWPLSSILITSTYGSRWGKFHYGLDFRAAIGTAVTSMAGGEVLGVGDTDLACKGASFGKWVFIKYNNGLSSTYGHLSAINVKAGQKVKMGDIVAYSGNTGSSTGPHLHVAVYASTGVKVDTVPSKSCNGKIFTQPIAALSAYLNPLSYLPKTIASMYK